MILCLGLLAAAQAGYDSINKDLVVTSCDRAIDMSTQLVKMSHKIVLQNNGQGAVKSFLFSVSPRRLCSKILFRPRATHRIMLHLRFLVLRSMISPVIFGPWGLSCISCKYLLFLSVFLFRAEYDL